MNNIILDYLEQYKSLDELCKQILSNEKGISAYIDEMKNETKNHSSIPCWENDYNSSTDRMSKIILKTMLIVIIALLSLNLFLFIKFLIYNTLL